MAKRKPVAKKPAARSAAKPRSAARSAKGSKARSGARKAAAPAKKDVAGERRRHDPQTLRLRAFQPGLTVNDLPASIRFYTDVLGFIVGERWTDNNVLLGVSLKAGVCSLGLSQDDWAKGKNRKKGEGVRLWCETVQDIDALAERIKSEGWTLTQEPKFQPWGMRLLEVDDPDGYHLTIFKNK
jgi:catechol 2,3-dioxygenase-like lactoylglutathione lyase family enzyme